MFRRGRNDGCHNGRANVSSFGAQFHRLDRDVVDGISLQPSQIDRAVLSGNTATRAVVLRAVRDEKIIGRSWTASVIPGYHCGPEEEIQIIEKSVVCDTRARQV